MKRVKNEVYMIIAALICALVFIYSAPYLGGAGGKLGTIAFGSVISVFGLYQCLKFISERKFFNREAKI